MTDDKVKPIAPAMMGPSISDGAIADEPIMRCMGCAGPMHGSIGQHIACLERAIADLLGTMRWSKQHLEAALEVTGAANPLASPATTVVRALDSKLGRRQP